MTIKYYLPEDGEISADARALLFSHAGEEPRDPHDAWEVEEAITQEHERLNECAAEDVRERVVFRVVYPDGTEKTFVSRCEWVPSYDASEVAE